MATLQDSKTFYEVDEKLTHLIYRGNVGDEVYLFGNALYKVKAKKSGERSAKIRVQLYNNKKYRVRDCSIYMIMGQLIEMIKEVTKIWVYK